MESAVDPEPTAEPDAAVGSNEEAEDEEEVNGQGGQGEQDEQEEEGQPANQLVLHKSARPSKKQRQFKKRMTMAIIRFDGLPLNMHVPIVEWTYTIKENVFILRLCNGNYMKKSQLEMLSLSSQYVGKSLRSDKKFKQRICEIVWNDSIEIDDFESRWKDVMNEFNLTTNKWMAHMYSIRWDWIPAYYRHEHMSGLMRTTSRSESENHFFGKFINRRIMLVEFLSNFETAIEAQRFTHRKNDHDTRYKTPDWAVNKCMSVHTSEAGDFIKFKIKELDHERSGLYENHTVTESNQDDSSYVERIVREIMLSNDYIVNQLVYNMENLVLYRDELKRKMTELSENGRKSQPIPKKDRIANLLGLSQPSEDYINRPHGIQTKGYGSKKRFKSIQEQVASKTERKLRCCQLCGSFDHDRRTCPCPSKYDETL
ncbi:hypothetical protein E3N88_28397 [Mikania micrantha]|uniref:Uncharacterized protein n=1 Tax=Mikania micrantha TaxID=192012 RepID=A0A5N6N0D2_9ASTR|nr:hypothetical protein E3N88_28397 [Mikania micrantha]